VRTISVFAALLPRRNHHRLAAAAESRELSDYPVVAVGGLFDDSYQAADEIGRIHAFGIGVEVGEDSVPHHWYRGGADIVIGSLATAVEHRPCLGGEDEVLAGSWAGAAVDKVVDEIGRAVAAGPRGPHEPHGILGDDVGHGHAPHDSLEVEDVLLREHFLRVRPMDVSGGVHDLFFFELGGVIDEDIEHESVELRLGQGVCAFLLERVLRGEHEKGHFEAVRVSGGRYAVFLHRLEECGLCLRRRAVDLVGKEHIGEDRPADESEVFLSGSLFLLQDVGPGDVRRHEVGRELHSLELEVEDLSYCADHQSFCEAGHPDHEAVPTREHGGEHFFEDPVLADDDLVNFGADSLHSSIHVIDGFELDLFQLRAGHGLHGRRFAFGFLYCRGGRGSRPVCIVRGWFMIVRDGLFDECEGRMADSDLVAVVQRKLVIPGPSVLDQGPVAAAQVADEPYSILVRDFCMAS